MLTFIDHRLCVIKQIHNQFIGDFTITNHGFLRSSSWLIYCFD